MRKNQSQYSADDHTDKHKCGHIITGLHQEPHRKYRSQEDICKCDVHPHLFSQDHRQIHSAYKRKHRACQAEDHFFPAGQLCLSLDKSENSRKQDKEQGDAPRRAVYRRIFRKRRHTVCYHISIEGIRHHVRERRHDDQSEQPAESQE